jgi:dolichyl-phosphate beta-glucosyltransferase
MKPPALSYTYVVPVHNEEATIARTVARITERAKITPIVRVLAVENGSRDASWAALQEVARAVPMVTALQEPQAGLGYALHRGVQEACAIDASPDHYVVFTACDLPFGFTDLDAFEALAPRPAVAIGSKAHPDSQIQKDARRVVMSWVYRLARRAIVGMKTRDSQGTFFLRADVAATVWPRIVARDFFYTTELCVWLERAGVIPVEVPVVYEGEQRASSVRPWKHGTAMLRQLWALRGRARALP